MHKKITNSKPSNNITDLQMKSKKQTDLITGMNVQFWKKVPELKMDMLLKDEVNYNLWETEVPALFNKQGRKKGKSRFRFKHQRQQRFWLSDFQQLIGKHLKEYYSILSNSFWR